MKTKHLGKKFLLNKATVADLSNGQLGYLRGGGNTNL